MLGFFKKKTRKAVIEVKKMENRDAVEATVWGAYMISYATAHVTQKKLPFLRRQLQLCLRFLRLLVKLPK